MQFASAPDAERANIVKMWKKYIVKIVTKTKLEVIMAKCFPKVCHSSILGSRKCAVQNFAKSVYGQYKEFYKKKQAQNLCIVA